MNYLDLFAGIGGNAYAAQQAGLHFKNHLFSEIEPYCVELYKQNYPDAIALGSIKEIDAKQLKKEYGNEWIITGGFPCQDLSTAGKRQGITTDTRSGLWNYYAKIIETIKPKFCIIENVRGLLSLGMQQILQDLSACGYDAEWHTIRACDVGLPHNRQRVWIVAYPTQTRYTGNSKSYKRQRNMGELFQLNSTINGKAVMSNWEGEKTQWNLYDQPYIYRKNNGIPNELYQDYTARVAELGNSIVPQIAQKIMERIKELSGNDFIRA